MSAETFVSLIEEMVELKVQHHLAQHVKVPAHLARVVAEKRESDRLRSEQIKAQLVRLLTAQSA